MSDAAPEEPLLRIKLFAPPVRPNRVSRPRLFDQIHCGLDKALILVTAPAGYGKTTLLSSWLSESGTPYTWLSLDESDNDPIRFLQYFITALQKNIPTIHLNLLGVLQGRQPNPRIALMNILINEISGHAAPFVLVLDDFHTLTSQPVLEMLSYLLEHIPLQMHIVLLSRTDPPLPLARLRVRNQLIDIRADQLRFTREEVAKFLIEAMALELSSDDITALEARTEGWIAGLQLAALALQGQISKQGGKGLHDFVSAFTGSHYYIMDYLAEEVLGRQTEAVRTFLLHTSILDRMCGSLCDEVIEFSNTGSSNGQAVLEALEQMNMFIIPLDSERRWYRYHHLFADVLSRRLEQNYPHLLGDLHRQASRWYERNGLFFDAIRHGLLAGDRDRAAQLLDQNGCHLLMSGEVVNLLQWIEAVEPYPQPLPWIAIQKAWALCLTGQLDQVEAALQTATQIISSLPMTDEVKTLSGAVTGARAFRANMQGENRLAASFAHQALDELPASSGLSCCLRSATTSILGDASWIDGNLDEAHRAYADAVLIGQATGNVYMVIIANSNLGDILLEQGELQQSFWTYTKTMQLAALPDGKISPLAERVYAGLSRISYEWNNLEEAAKYAQQCIELSQRWGSTESKAVSYLVLAGSEHVQSRPAKARDALKVAEQLIGENPLTPWRSNALKADLARGWIAQGNLEKASYLIQQSGIPIDRLPQNGEISYPLEPVYITLLHLHQARGDNDATLALSDQLLHKLDGANRTGRVIEILVLRALAFQGKRDIDQALVVLQTALSLAQPEGYVRTFLDEGEPMAKLLYLVKSRLPGTAYAMELLTAMGSAFNSSLPPATLLIEPLTVRELEVIQLIEAGCSNQEIADRLVIALPTVKRHISNIYDKLGANSRTQAVSRAKELNFFK